MVDIFYKHIMRESQNNPGYKTQEPGNEQVIFYITDGGRELAQKIGGLYPEARTVRFKSVGAIHELPLLWNGCKNLIFIMATGIVVRAVAPLLKDKKTDPAVVVLDERGQYVISLLSGHLGGANALAKEIADYLGAQAVITTASDVLGKVALDIWAAEKNLYVEDYEKMKQLSTKIVNGQKIKVRSEDMLNADHMPDEFEIVGPEDRAEMIITNRILDEDALFLRPGNLFVGLGCNRGTSKEEIKEVTSLILQEEKLSMNSVRCLASIDLKKDERGLLDFAGDQGLDIDFFSKDELNDAVSAYDIASSDTVKNATGAAAVAEPAAILAAKKRYHNGTIIIPKRKRGNVTLAIAKAKFML